MPGRKQCRRSFIALLIATLPILPGIGAAQSHTAPISARLYDANVAWSGTVGTRVAARLERGGLVVASVADFVRVNGEAWLRLRPVAGAPPAVIRPGDRIVLTPDRLSEITVTVPPLAADLAADGQSVHVHAMAGVTVTLRGPAADASAGPGPYTVGADGRLRIPLAAPFDGRGIAEVAVWVPGGHAFRTGFDPLRVEIEVGAKVITGRASAGARVQVEVAPAATQGQIAAIEALTSPWRIELPEAEALVPGTAVTITRTSPAIAAPHVLAGRVPVLNVGVVGGGLRIVGEGQPGAAVRLAIGIRPPIVVRVDEGGQFAYELEGASALLPGEIIKASLENPAGLTFYATTAHTPMEVLLYGTKVSAVIDVPGADVEVSLHDAQGTLKARGTAKSITTASTGAPAGTFHFDAGVRIEPGDVVTVDWGTGDPLVVVVPMVTAIADPVMDIVAGTAPPGTHIETAMFDAHNRRVNVRHVTAGNDGRYLVDYRGERDIAFGKGGDTVSNGVVTVRSGAGDLFDLAWAAVEVDIEIGQGPKAAAPSGRDVRVVLSAPDGRVLGTWQGQVTQRNAVRAISSWQSQVVDSAGQPVEAQPGDRWDITVADQHIVLDMPRFSAALDVPGRRVLGQTEPSAVVRAYAPDAVGHTLTTTSDELGFFTVDLNEGRDLRYDDYVVASVVIVAPHDATFFVRGAAMTIDLDALRVSGAHEPHLELELTLNRAETAIARGRTRASPRGLFEAVLASLSAGRVEPQEGDRLALSAPGAMGEASVAFELPELTVVLDRAARAIFGRATVGGVLRVDLGPAYERHMEGAIYHHPPTEPITITADGTYRLELPSTTDEGPDLRPGQFADVQYTLPSGHRAKRRRYLPMANVHLGGAEVCGVGSPWSPVEVELRNSAGQPLASARGTTDARGRYTLVLRDAAGNAVTTAPKQTVAVALDDAELSVPLQAVAITMTWAAERIGHSGLWLAYEGNGPPRRDYYEQAVRARCLLSVDEGAGAWGQWQTGASGQFGGERGTPAMRPGQQFEVAFYADSGNRYYVRGDRGLIRAEVGTERVTGHAVPFSAVSLVLRSASGAERATAAARADLDGAYMASLRDGTGQPVAMAPGDVLGLASATGEENAMIEGVGFDYSQTGLVGQAPPGREVVVTLTLADGRELAFPRVADGSGRFQYRDADRPREANWSFADAVHVRVVLETEEGHEMVAQGRIGGDPPGPARTIYLPMAWHED